MSRTKSLTEKDHLVSQHHRRPLFFNVEDVKNWSKSFVKMKDFSNFGLNFLPRLFSGLKTDSRRLVSFNIASKASYVYILSGQKLI